MSFIRQPGMLWEGLLHTKNPRCKDWKPLWVVLNGKTLHLYKDNENYTIVGEWFLDSSVKLKIVKKEYLYFTLSQRKGKTEQLFKCQCKSDREMWRGFILGVAQGNVPRDLDWTVLLPGHKEELQKFADGLPKNGNPISPTSPSHRLLSSERRSSSVVSAFSPSSPSTPRSDYPVFDYGKARDNSPPQLQEILKAYTWYFPDIDQETGERILEVGDSRGNFLVRPAGADRRNDFIIQFRACKERDDARCYSFLIEKTDLGFRVVINNADILSTVREAAMKPKASVFDAINFVIIHVAKAMSVISPRLMSTNDLNKFGLCGELSTQGSRKQTNQSMELEEDGSNVYSTTEDVLAIPPVPPSPPPPLPPINPPGRLSHVRLLSTPQIIHSERSPSPSPTSDPYFKYSVSRSPSPFNPQISRSSSPFASHSPRASPKSVSFSAFCTNASPVTGNVACAFPPPSIPDQNLQPASPRTSKTSRSPSPLIPQAPPFQQPSVTAPNGSFQKALLVPECLPFSPPPFTPKKPPRLHQSCYTTSSPQTATVRKSSVVATDVNGGSFNDTDQSMGSLSRALCGVKLRSVIDQNGNCEDFPLENALSSDVNISDPGQTTSPTHKDSAIDF